MRNPLRTKLIFATLTPKNHVRAIIKTMVPNNYIKPDGFNAKHNFTVDGHEPFSEYSIKFDLMSFVGRSLYARHPNPLNGYCNLGCGPRYIPDYCNADFFSFARVRKLLGRQAIRTDWELDLRHPIKCEDGVFHGVLMEHVLEHLSMRHAQNILKELRRIIKPGGRLRISVPNLSKYIDFYNGSLPHPKFYNWAHNPAEAIWSMAYNFGHHSLYDFQLIRCLLENAGFENVIECSLMNSHDPMLRIDDPGRSWESLYVEAH